MAQEMAEDSSEKDSRGIHGIISRPIFTTNHLISLLCTHHTPQANLKQTQ